MSNKPRKIKMPQKRMKVRENIPSITSVDAMIKDLYEKIMEAVERRVRIAELKSQMSTSKIEDAVDTIKANQAVTQTLIGEKGFYTQEEFQAEFAHYVENVLGVVNDGRMNGTVVVGFYNIGNVPVPTSAVQSHKGGGPVFID